MNRDTRDRMASRTQPDLTGGNACWETAPLLYAALASAFGPFAIDLTADSQRALCPTHFGPGGVEPDAVTASWTRYGRSGFSNPPYGPFVGAMLAKARQEADQGFASTLLLPLRMTQAFRTHVIEGATEVLLCDRRLVFFENGIPRCSIDKRGRIHINSAFFDSVIVRFTPNRAASLTFRLWHVPTHVTEADIERAAERLRAAA